MDLSVALLKHLNVDKGTPYSTLLLNEHLVEQAGSIDNLTALLYKLIAQGFAKIEVSVEESGTEEVFITLTKLGQSFIKMKERVHEVSKS